MSDDKEQPLSKQIPQQAPQHLRKTVRTLKERLNNKYRLPVQYHGRGELTNAGLLEEISALFDAVAEDNNETHKKMDEICIKQAYLEGTIAEMQRHNGKIIKMLVGVIATIVPAFCAMIAWLIGLL